MGKRELQKAIRRQAILDAARALILDGKSRDFSMIELAEKAGVSLATPYNLFGSKSSILLEIVREDIFERVEAIEALKCDSLADWVQELSQTLARIYYRNRHYYRRMLVALVAQENAEIQREGLAFSYSVFEAAIARLYAEGKLTQVIPAGILARHLARNIAGSLQYRLMERGSEEGLRLDIEMGILLMLAGLCAAADQTQLLQRMEILGREAA